MYAATTGTFLQRDPAGYTGDAVLEYSHAAVTQLMHSRRRSRFERERIASNLYEYVYSNPIKYVDPKGLQGEIYSFPDFPAPIDFPAPGTSSESKPNAKTFWPSNCTPFSCPTKKPTRIVPIPNLGNVPSPVPFGPPGGSYKWYGLPANGPIGGGGAAPCAIAVIKCSDGAAVYHFSSGDNPLWSLGWSSVVGSTGDWSGCEAIVCGGDDSNESNCLHDQTLAALKSLGIKVVGVSTGSACGFNPDGTWYEKM